MHKFSKIFTLTLGLFLFVQSIMAHDPGQISYDFQQQGQMGLLTIHLTPKGAIDLLRSVKPELENESIINPNDHDEVFTMYFNQTISLKINEKEVSFNFLEANLGQHDATMTFQLINFNDSFEGFQLNVTSFTDIYPRVVNYVFIPLQLGQQQYILDGSQTYCSPLHLSKNMTLQKFEMSKTSKYIWIGGVTSIFLIFVAFAFRKISRRDAESQRIMREPIL